MQDKVSVLSAGYNAYFSQCISTDSDEEVEFIDKKLAREVSVLEDLQHEEEELDKKQKVL